MDSADNFQTKTSRVYRKLKADITAGKYKPGQHLVRRDMVKRFGVSLSIVNEALGRLGSDGLVEMKEMYGTRVISLSGADLRNELVLREAIERHVVRLLVEQGSDATLTQMLDEARAVDQWTKEQAHDDTDGSMLHLEFHLKLARSTGFSTLEDCLKRTSIRTMLTTRWLSNQRLPHPPDFHEQLVRTIIRRDPILADQAMRDHLHYGEPSGKEST